MSSELIEILSVSEASQLLKAVVEKAFGGRIKIRGELSGITRAASGHIYLSIKDSDSVINCIIWRGTPVNFDLSDGIEVIATGKFTTYPARSNYQLIISEIDVAGLGGIFKMLDERKKKLEAEGLFNPMRKKPLPKFPKTIGIVTSPTGAAIQDMLNKLRERLPVTVFLYPAQVQGVTAAAEVTAGIKYFNEVRPVDVIIVARGGGAIEDLLPFSEEIVVRAVAASVIPVISGVGHEPDWMLIDYAADYRAPTPTGAAEIVVPTKLSLSAELENMGRIMRGNFMSRIQNAQMRMDAISIKSPAIMIQEARRRVLDTFKTGEMLFANGLRLNFQKTEHMGQMLESLSYRNILKRGYAIVRRRDRSGHGGAVITSAADFATPARIEFQDGVVQV